ncbi:peptidase family C78-domain-containing protein [Dichomitus squalens]|uniref:Peptidase family C78-domain-containing protein n=1 Tax=Dichomitus squalens TaxID=114155 RepID=A0A4Q9QDX7_9APHY|nr:peptidase family C78-domain-containing protein [Dichomitus squalens]
MGEQAPVIDDGELEILAQNDPKKIICQICAEDLTPMTIIQRDCHYDEHFEGPSRASGSGSSGMTGGTLQSPQAPKPPSKLSSMRPRSGFRPLSFHNTSPEEQNIFWHSGMTSEPPRNFTPGLMTVLKKALNRSHDKGNTQRAWLCMETAVYIQGEHWDRTWGCGYRNYLMACAALMNQQLQPDYFPLLDTPSSPGVRNLQILIERAWRDGYDEEGAKDMDRKLVGTKKWIGTAELYVAFTYKGIPAQLVDFELHNGVEPLLQWVLQYFSGEKPHRKSTSSTVSERLLGARAVTITHRPPIVLQHAGHSRTIVGAEQVKGGIIHLLTFDPGRRLPPSIRQAGLKYHDPTRSGGTQGPSLSKKVLHNVLHPVETMKSRKRKSPEPQGGSPKRKRGGNTGSREVIVIDDNDDDHRKVKPPSSSNQSTFDALSPADVLKVFRLDAKTLNKNKKYQILYFPMTEPLSEAEKLNRRIVTSEKIV